MKIVHELHQLDFGGVEKIVRNIIAFDKKNEHTIIAYKDGKYRKNLEDVGARIVLLESAEQDIDEEADVVHIHTGGAVSELGTQLGGQFPIVETIHSPVRSPMSSKIITQRVGVSDGVSRLNDKCMTIYNGLDLSQMETTKTKEQVKAELGIEGKLVVGRLGRLGKDKGLEEWMLVCYYLQQAGVDFVPLIVGDEARNASGYRGVLKLMAASLPVKNCVWVPNSENISDYLQVMDIFLYPSQTEGFGLVFAEAIYNESVVVAYQTPILFELFGGYSYLIAKEKGIHGLVEYTKKVIESQELQDEIKSIGPQFIAEHYDAENMSLNYQELYERCHADFNRTVHPQEANVVPAG